MSSTPRACPRAGRARCTRRTGRPRRCLHPELPGPAVAGTCRGHVDRSGSHVPSGSTDLRLLVAETHGYRLHLVDHPPAFDRDGLYGPPGGGDHADNAWRSRSCAAQRSSISGPVARRASRPTSSTSMTGTPAPPRCSGTPSTATTRRSVGPRSCSPSTTSPTTAGPRRRSPSWAAPRPRRSATGRHRLLRAGIERAELVNTVSPGFAAEALTPAFGMGLDGDLGPGGDRFLGILNGLDTDLWDPATDAALPATYSRDDRTGKAACRAALLEELGLGLADDRPVLSMIGRLDRQKGFDLLADATPALLERASAWRCSVPAVPKLLRRSGPSPTRRRVEAGLRWSTASTATWPGRCTQARTAF